MKIFQGTDIKKLDEYTIENEPVASIDLMERAAKALLKEVTARWSTETIVTVFAGPGNNGGDALALARMLAEESYQVNVYLFNIAGKLSDDCQANKDRLADVPNLRFTEVVSSFEPPKLGRDDLVIDGLFGSGISRPLSGGFAAVAKYINDSSAQVVSIDMPSGLMCEDNTYNMSKNTIVHATLTLSIQLPKLAFLFAENELFVGEWVLVDIGLSEEAIRTLPTDYAITELQEVRQMLKPRGRFAHKGHFGHALLIAGSYGMAGAATLAAKACLRSGVGLLTVHTPARNLPILQVGVPEAIIEPDLYEDYFATPADAEAYSAVAIGPGLGCRSESVMAFDEQIRYSNTPLVLDADALNLLSEHKELIAYLPKNSVLTPHPKELDRLLGQSRNSFDRLNKALRFAVERHVYVVLKGAYTAVVTPDGKCHFNPTGNPGMATAGSGDVLTGIILALLAQGYSPEQACRLGVYAHGLAGDIAAAQNGQISMTAGDIVDALHKAWAKLS